MLLPLWFSFKWKFYPLLHLIFVHPNRISWVLPLTHSKQPVARHGAGSTNRLPLVPYRQSSPSSPPPSTPTHMCACPASSNYTSRSLRAGLMSDLTCTEDIYTCSTLSRGEKLRRRHLRSGAPPVLCAGSQPPHFRSKFNDLFRNQAGKPQKQCTWQQYLRQVWTTEIRIQGANIFVQAKPPEKLW